VIGVARSKSMFILRPYAILRIVTEEGTAPGSSARVAPKEVTHPAKNCYRAACASISENSTCAQERNPVRSGDNGEDTFRGRSWPARAVCLYGTVVDGVDSAPSTTALPAALPRRAEKGITATDEPATGMTHRGEIVTLTGQGYFRVRWQILPGERPGSVVMPTWTGLDGKLFHVASGGGHRMDDVQPGATDGTTWMGGPSTGVSVLPSGTQHMWQNEYFWIDGTVTLHQNERGADYNLFVETSTWDKAAEDIRTGPAQGVIRYGLVRDNGKDTAPVPQYVTRATMTDPATVLQRSHVTP